LRIAYCKTKEIYYTLIEYTENITVKQTYSVVCSQR